MAELVVDHSVLVCVSSKLLKVERGLCSENILQLCVGKRLWGLERYQQQRFGRVQKDRNLHY